MFDLISTAHAATQAGPEAAMGNIIFMVALFAIFYFFLIRPQQKQVKAHKEMVANLGRGDSVVTTGGLVGRIHRIEEDIVVLEVGDVEIGTKTFRPIRIRLRRLNIIEVTAKANMSLDKANVSLDKEKPAPTEESQG